MHLIIFLFYQIILIIIVFISFIIYCFNCKSKPFVLVNKNLFNTKSNPIKFNINSPCLDIFSNTKNILPPHSRQLILTGIYLESIPESYFLRVSPINSLVEKGIDICSSIIDSNYNDEIKVVLMNTTETPYIINPYEKIAQLIPEKYYNGNLFIKNIFHNETKKCEIRGGVNDESKHIKKYNKID
jgi:dUTP pyrophosphatase